METRFYRLHMVICLSSINNKQRGEGRNETTDFLEKNEKIPKGFPILSSRPARAQP